MALRRGQILADERAVDPGRQRLRIDTLIRTRRRRHVFTLPSQESFDRTVAFAAVTHGQFRYLAFII